MADAVLRFKRGSLNNLKSQPIIDGTIYVTTDERAMYVDNGTTRIRLGDFIEYSDQATFSEAVTKNPNLIVPEAFYYIREDNMLLKYVDGIWKHINSGGSSGITDFLDRTVAITNGVVVGSTLKFEKAESKSASTTFTTGTPNKLTITPGTGSNSEVIFKVDETEINGKLTVEDNTITFTNTKTGTNAAGDTVNTSTEGGSVEFIASDGGAVIETSGTTIDIKTKPQSISTRFNNGVLATTIRTAANDSISSAGVIPAIRIGNIVTQTRQFNVSDTLSSGSNSFSAAVAELPVYTIDQVNEQINSKLRAANAMTFKGHVTPTEGLPQSNADISIGDTYIVSTAGDINGRNARVGDLFIANGTENADGIIISSTLVWEYVPAGDDEAYQLRLNTSTNGIAALQGGVGEFNTLAMFRASDGLVLETEGTSVYYKHGPQLAALDGDAAASYRKTGETITGSATVSAITGLNFDTHGHLVDYTVQTFNLNSIHIKSAATTVATGNVANGVTVGTTYTYANSDTFSSYFNIDTSGQSAIQVTNSGAGTVRIDTVWTEF